MPIHFFSPSSTHSSPSRRAVVAQPAGDPGAVSGSVRPKAPISSIRAIAGSQRSCCSSEPHRWIEPIASPPCTPMKVASTGRPGPAPSRPCRRAGAAAGAAGAVERQAGDAQVGDAGHQVVRELGARPVVVDDRLDCGSCSSRTRLSSSRSSSRAAARSRGSPSPGCRRARVVVVSHGCSPVGSVVRKPSITGASSSALGEDAEVAAVVDVQPGARDQPGHACGR